jgi:hypothetical protein
MNIYSAGYTGATSDGECSPCQPGTYQTGSGRPPSRYLVFCAHKINVIIENKIKIEIIII